MFFLFSLYGGPGTKKYFKNVDDVKQNDELKNKLAKEHGFEIVRIWESEVKETPNLILEKLDGCI